MLVQLRDGALKFWYAVPMRWSIAVRLTCLNSLSRDDFDAGVIRLKHHLYVRGMCSRQFTIKDEGYHLVRRAYERTDY